ncbi:MAG: KH domain-containing protein [Lachnospiraceae bacterium]
MLKKIGSSARQEIERMMETKINLQLWVKVRKEWRDSELLMKNYGYTPEK